MRRAVHVFSFILFFPKLFLCHSILSCSQLPWFKVSLYWTVCARCLMSKINQQLRNNFSRATLAQRQREGGVSIPARHIFPPLPPLEASSPFLINHKSSKELMSTLGLVRSEQNCDFSCSSCVFLLNSSSHLPWDFARCWAWSSQVCFSFQEPVYCQTAACPGMDAMAGAGHQSVLPGLGLSRSQWRCELRLSIKHMRKVPWGQGQVILLPCPSLLQPPTTNPLGIRVFYCA